MVKKCLFGEKTKKKSFFRKQFFFSKTTVNPLRKKKTDEAKKKLDEANAPYRKKTKNCRRGTCFLKNFARAVLGEYGFWFITVRQNLE